VVGNFWHCMQFSELVSQGHVCGTGYVWGRVCVISVCTCVHGYARIGRVIRCGWECLVVACQLRKAAMAGICGGAWCLIGWLHAAFLRFFLLTEATGFSMAGLSTSAIRDLIFRRALLLHDTACSCRAPSFRTLFFQASAPVFTRVHSLLAYVRVSVAAWGTLLWRMLSAVKC